MRLCRKVDENQAEIVEALRSIGCRVLDLSAVGGGVPDVAVLYKGIIYLLEIKRPKVGKLNALQKAFHAEWAEAPIFVVRTVEEAFRAIGAAVRAIA